MRAPLMTVLNLAGAHSIISYQSCPTAMAFWTFSASRMSSKSCAIAVCRKKDISVGLDVPPYPSMSGATTPNPLSEK